MEEVDLGSFIRESMPTYNVLHSDLNISFLDQRTCHVVHNVNTILLSCLLNNLVVNAIRHTAAMNGEIRLLLCNSYFTVSNPADGVSLNARTLSSVSVLMIQRRPGMDLDFLLRKLFATIMVGGCSTFSKRITMYFQCILGNLLVKLFQSCRVMN